MRDIIFGAAVLCLVAFLGTQYLSQKLDETPQAQANYAQQQPVRNNRGGDVTFRADSDGHVRLSADVEGRPMEFLVDTGASAVALRESDARRAGYRLNRSDYTAMVSTANGKVAAAPIMIRDIEVDNIRVTNVRGLVLPDEALGKNLLGMTFLGRLRRFEMSRGQLVMEN
jgi:aspartyl protease family protein